LLLAAWPWACKLAFEVCPGEISISEQWQLCTHVLCTLSWLAVSLLVHWHGSLPGLIRAVVLLTGIEYGLQAALAYDSGMCPAGAEA
jgi:hypothetical protein